MPAKIQLIIRKYRRHGLANESIERSLMLTRTAFFGKLLDFMLSSTTATTTTTTTTATTSSSTSSLTSSSDQLKALDLLTWIVYNHSSDSSTAHASHLASLREHLLFASIDKFLAATYLFGNRSTSRKATLLLTMLLNPRLDPSKAFAALILDKLLELMKYLLCFESSAALNWFFTLFYQV